MMRILDYPLLVFVLSLVVLLLSARTGSYLRRRRGKLDPEEGEDLNIIVAATLTLLGLIIGFTFSMATNRYDQRKGCEATEANAIGTEYVRVELLPASDIARAQGLLKRYLDQRILFYTTRDAARLQQIGAATAQLQQDLWSAVRSPAVERQTPTLALAASGMNDVLNSQAYTQAAWWNRIPSSAWALMAAIAICGNFLLGYAERRPESTTGLLFILPLVLSIAFFLIADIDSPLGGLIRLHPQNLASLSMSLVAQ